MARHRMRVVAVLAAMGCVAPLAAQSVDDDVRCLLAANVFAQNEKDPMKRQLAASASVFYLGRLDARIPTPQLKTAVVAQAKTLQMAQIGSIMTSCAKRMVEKGAAMQTVKAGPGGRTPPPPPAGRPK